MIHDVKFRLDVLRGGAYFKTLSLPADAPVQINCSSSALITRSMSAAFVKDPEIDLMKDEFQPMLSTGDGWKSLGVFRCTTPKDSNDGYDTRVSIEAYDRAWVCQANTTAERLFIPAGTAYSSAVGSLLTKCGITSVSADRMDLATSTDHEWGLGVSLLTIINELLAELNFRPLWFDAAGTARLTKYSEPDADRIKFQYSATDIKRRPIAKEFSSETDLFNAPNRFICVCANPDKTDNMTAISVNESPVSQKSILRRGITITKVVQLRNIADQASLQSYADRLRNESMLASQTVVISTALESGHEPYDIAAVDHPEIGGIYVEIGWSMQLQAGELMQHELRKTVI